MITGILELTIGVALISGLLTYLGMKLVEWLEFRR